jgi:colicin import membrane protein
MTTNFTDVADADVIDAEKTAVAEYKPFYTQLADLEKNNALIVFDYSTSKGNKEARSHVHTLRLTKGALERARKAAKDESLRIGRAIDSEARQIEGRIDAMILVHQEKLDEIDQRERDREQALHERVQSVVNFGAQAETAAQFQEAIAGLEQIAIDDTWQELTASAAKAKDARLGELRTMLTAAVQFEAEQAELARLRAEAEARAQQERDEAVAKAAVERANAEAEARAQQEREAAARRELELKLQAENAERRRIEAEQKAEQDRKDAANRAAEDKARAVKAEQDRVAAVARMEADARAAREADIQNRAAVNRAALAALVVGGVNEEAAKTCLKLIANGKVPAVHIDY